MAWKVTAMDVRGRERALLLAVVIEPGEGSTPLGSGGGTIAGFAPERQTRRKSDVLELFDRAIDTGDATSKPEMR
jgi:hypothetical protein